MKQNYQIKVTLDDETVKPIVAPYVKRIKELEKENEKLLKNAMNVANAKMRDKIKDLEERDRMAYGHFDSNKEKHQYEVFCKKHRHMEQFKRQESCAVKVARPPYIIEEPNSIGSCKKAVCPICGEEKDITDIGTW